STADAYRWWDELGADRPLEAWHKVPTQLADWDAVARMAENDFDEPVGRHHPEVRALQQALREAGAVVAMLSGSGSTVIGVFPGVAPAQLARVTSIRTRTASTVSPGAVVD